MARMLSAREHAAGVLPILQKISHQARDLQVITMRGQLEGELSYTQPGRLMREMYNSSMQLAANFGDLVKLCLNTSGLNEPSYSHRPTVAASATGSSAATSAFQHQVNTRSLHIQLSQISGAAEAMIRQMDLFMQSPTQSSFNELVTLQAMLVEAIGTVSLDWGACLELQDPHGPVPQLQNDTPAAAGNAAAAAPLQDHEASNAAVSVAPTENPTQIFLQDYLRDDDVDMEDIYEGASSSRKRAGDEISSGLLKKRKTE